VGTDIQDDKKTAAERMAATRIRLLDAVIETLGECGYAATSTSEVARRSGFTRGAQLHHFGTKDQMMVAAVEHLNEMTRSTDISAVLAHITDDRERIDAALAIMSHLFAGPWPAAYVELWVASRAHPELADALKEADVAARDAVRSLFGEAILSKAGADFDALLDLTMYALRGMALDAHLVGEEDLQARSDLIVGLANSLEEALS
jgi:AcrR family transcriptional regulator